MTAACLRKVIRQPRTAIMGVVNVTPDSFSDGGQFFSTESAVSHALQLIDEGADILDIGGESTRPGAVPVDANEELARVLPIIQALAKETTTPISIDTAKPEVMRAAIEAGASMINDVNGLLAEDAVEVAIDLDAHVCIMHMQGQPRTMQHSPQYQNIVQEVISFLSERVAICKAKGLHASKIIVDPGIGFGKTLEHNLRLLNALAEIITETGCNLMIGVSRKSLIGDILGRPVEQRIAGGLGLAVQAALNGAKILRVHDVAATHDAIRCVEAVTLVSSDKE